VGLAHRVIVTMLVKGTKLVKGRRFSADRVVGHAAQAIRIQQARGVDELVMLDVTATAEGRGPDLALVEKLSEELRSPFAVGGGIRTVDDVRNVLRAGADKVVIGTASLNPQLSATARMRGLQAIVASIDVAKGEYGYVHYVDCGKRGSRRFRNTASGVGHVAWCTAHAWRRRDPAHLD
jgi:cyclase